MKIALLSMPWQDPTMPSIQLGALKAYLNRTVPEVEVHCHSVFLDVLDILTDQDIETLGNSGIWLGEGVFARGRFGADCQRAAFLESEKRNLPPLSKDVDALIEAVLERIDQSIDAMLLNEYDLVGLSVVYGQTFASLYAVQRLRRSYDGPILLGGPAIAGPVGQSIVNAFPEIDAIVHGEGERPLREICERILSAQDWKDIAGVMSRGAPEAAVHEVSSLDELPVPDFEEYFCRLSALGHSDRILPRARLPIETSRGCWWDRSDRGQDLACSFCNLNLQWSKYREKTVANALNTIESAVVKYNIPRLVIVDNIIRYEHIDPYLDGLQRIPADLDMFIEARAHIPSRIIERMKLSGVSEIQFGIEALNTEILRVLNKGTTAIQNIRAMKTCAWLGVRSSSNLITRIPNVTQRMVDEQLQLLKHLVMYEPVSVAQFCLVHGSPIQKDLEAQGVSDLGNHRAYKAIVPKEIESQLYFLEREHAARSMASWSETEMFLADWWHIYEKRRSSGGAALLRCATIGDVTEIVDERGNVPKRLILQGLLSRIHSATADIADIDVIAASLSVTTEDVKRAAEDLIGRDLLFAEGKKLLSLALPTAKSLSAIREGKVSWAA